MSAEEALNSAVGQHIAGGCDDCGAVQTMRKEDDGLYVLTIAHDDGCPTLAYHQHSSARHRLKALRQAWRWWRDLDPERVAADPGVDLAAEALAEAGGDRLLAIQAWRAGRMAELEVFGAALAERIEAGDAA